MNNEQTVKAAALARRQAVLLQETVEAQHAYWAALWALGEALGRDDLDPEQDLMGMTVERLLDVQSVKEVR